MYLCSPKDIQQVMDLHHHQSPPCNIDDGCILSMSVIDDGEEHKLVLISRKVQSSSDVNLSELRSV